jgi:tetratricopeptide (TPR) repeat protein
MKQLTGSIPWAGLVLGILMVLIGCQSPAKQYRQQQAELFMLDADRYLEQGMLDSALAAFGLALEENPNITDAHTGMGHIYRQHGDYELASRAFERATDIDPNNVGAQYYFGLMRQLLGHVREAINIYLRALAIDPEHFESHRDLASAYLQAGAAGLALPHAVRATQLNPDDQAAWCNLAAAYSLQGQYAEAVDAYRQAAELGQLNNRVLLGLADAHIHLKHYARAINVLESLISSDPSATAYERMGFALFKTRVFDKALKNFRRALALTDSDTAALNGIGACLTTLYIQGEYENRIQRDQAIEAWRRSIHLKADQPRIIDLLNRYGRI